MAYNPGSRFGPPQRPQYNERAASYDNPHGNGPSHGPRAFNGRHESNERHDSRRPHDAYQHRDKYAGYSQNPWADQNGEYGGEHENHGGVQWRRQEERPYAEQSKQRPMRAQLNGHDDLGGRALSASGQRPPNRPPYQQYNGINRDEALQAWREPGTAHHGVRYRTYDGYGHEQACNDTRPALQKQQYGSSPQDLRSYSSPQEDRLPRYLNAKDPIDSNPQRPDSRSRKTREPTSGFDPAGSMNSTSVPIRPRSFDEQRSPETASWDNPFPTFPPKANRIIQGGSADWQGSSGGSRSVEKTFQDHGMNGPGPWKGGPAERTRTYQYDQVDYHEQHNRPATGDRSYSAEPTGNLKPPYVQGRHSEDNRSRPTLTHNLLPTTHYGRNRTMPTVLSEAAPESGLIPAEEASWQEPGAVSGYYGPRDHQYLQSGMESNAQRRPPPPPKAQSDESGRWGSKDAARPVQTFSARHPQVPEESHGEILDVQQEDVVKPHRAQEHFKGRIMLHSPEGEMPDSAGSPVSRNNGHRSDAHNYPHSDPREQAAQSHVPDYMDPYEPTTPNSNDYAASQPARSQSQPGYGESRPPKPSHKNGFEFGIPFPPEKRPATSADHRPYDRRPAMGNWQRPSLDLYSKHSNTHGAMPPKESRPDGIQRGQDARRVGHGTSNSERQRSPPVQNGRPPDHLMRQPPRGQSPQSSRGPISPLQKSLPNPDALPLHPAPMRLGLTPGPQSGHAPRPMPVRQYNSGPTDPVQHSAAPPGGAGKNVHGTVTPEELESLRQKIFRDPNDSATHMFLAQKLIEAADVFTDKQADPSTKKRSREKYQTDALKIIKKLSAISYAEADFLYADCYSRGALGLQSDINEAFILYQKAAKANHAQAAYRVAVCCELGQEDGGGTKRDAVKAMQWYKRAATLGDVTAMYKIGVIQLKGLLGQPKEPREAVTWLKRAAERADEENPHALHELALLHEKPIGINGIRQDEAYSRDLYTQAAALEYKFSQFRLGSAYEYGLLGCPVDPRQSIGWYSKAAVQEEHQSELALSGWYLTGSEGVLQQSDTEAYLWARKAAQAGLSKAEYAMGYFTEVGIGAPANLEDAKRWYWKSASQNFPKARDRLEDLRKGGGPKQKARVSRTNMRKQSDGECTVM